MIIYFIYLYLVLGLLCLFKNGKTPKYYIGILIFLSFKWIFNYRKCTLSWMECKIRGVKKEEGYLNSFLDKIVDIRYSKNIYIILTICFIIIIYEFIYNKRYKELLMLD
jgi:hypothetical protein